MASMVKWDNFLYKRVLNIARIKIKYSNKYFEKKKKKRIILKVAQKSKGSSSELRNEQLPVKEAAELGIGGNSPTTQWHILPSLTL